MFKIDTHTKQIFLSGVFVYISTISGLVFNYNAMQENHKVRISQLEVSSNKSEIDRKKLSAELGVYKQKNAAIEVMLSTLNITVSQLNKTTTELGKIAARLDERSRENN